MAKTIEALPYEEALSRLESLLEAMEEGEVPLAVLVEKFAEGNQLLEVCEQRLREAELKIEKLKGDGEPGSFETVDPSEDNS